MVKTRKVRTRSKIALLIGLCLLAFTVSALDTVDPTQDSQELDDKHTVETTTLAQLELQHLRTKRELLQQKLTILEEVRKE